MAAQYLGAWSPSAIAAANTALVALLGASATFTVHSAADTELASIAISNPAGLVDPVTGALTITSSARDEAAVAGTASYASLRDSSNNVVKSWSCVQGTTPVTGYCVLRSLVLEEGVPVELLSFTVV